MDNETKQEIRKAIYESKEKSEDDFEKYITYISAGGLALTLTFMEKVVQLKEAIYVGLLVLGWVFLGITLLVNLISHFLSARYADASISDLDSEVEDIDKRIDKRNWKMDVINLSTIITLFIGITFIIIFVSINVNQ
ncbi:MAG TPA: hypothetical protein VD908_15775 [Cytophagales bacterium]|nr:hypothetical protein [Cytophagales bacterium]